MGVLAPALPRVSQDCWWLQAAFAQLGVQLHSVAGALGCPPAHPRDSMAGFSLSVRKELSAPCGAGLSFPAILRHIQVADTIATRCHARVHSAGTSNQAAAPCFLSASPPLAAFLNLAASWLTVQRSSWRSGDGSMPGPQR